MAALEHALQDVRSLQGLLPICSYCKKVRDGQDYWQEVEDYLSNHGDMTFSHGICPACAKEMRAEFQRARPPKVPLIAPE